MHSYPVDLKGDGETEALNRLTDAHDVALVDMMMPGLGGLAPPSSCPAISTPRC